MPPITKEPLTLENFDGGDTLSEVNAAIAVISAALDSLRLEKAKGEVTLKLGLQDLDDSGDFRKITAKVSVKLPQKPDRTAVFPVQMLDGKRQLVVDPAQDGDQIRLPAVTHIDDHRTAV